MGVSVSDCGVALAKAMGWEHGRPYFEEPRDGGPAGLGCVT